MTPLPSTIAVVLSCDMRISLLPRSPSGPPVWNLVTSSSFQPISARQPSTYVCTLRVVMPNLSCGIPPRLTGLPVVNDRQ